MLNTETNPQCNAKIALRHAQSAMEKKHLNAQNANKASFYNKQPANLNAAFNGWTQEMEFADNVLIYIIAFNVSVNWLINKDNSAC